MIVATLLGRPRRLFSACAAASIAAGCANAPEAHLSPPSSEQTVVREAARLGRYRLVEIGADVAQRDLMEQIVNISTPDSATATVADALRFALLRTGYGLCESIAAGTSAFSHMPLPAPHYHLGPIRLRDALHVLAGPAWILEVDDSERQVCFSIDHAGSGTPTLDSGASSNIAIPATAMPMQEPEPQACSGITRDADSNGPPFTPLHIERRGNEYVLTVNSACSGSAVDTRDLRVGDVELGWRLTHLTPTGAEFVVAGRRQLIALP